VQTVLFRWPKTLEKRANPGAEIVKGTMAPQFVTAAAGGAVGVAGGRRVHQTVGPGLSWRIRARKSDDMSPR
jgi:hypothetical protein